MVRKHNVTDATLCYESYELWIRIWIWERERKRARMCTVQCVSVEASGGMKYSGRAQAGERKVYSERGGALSSAHDAHSGLRLGSGHGLLQAAALRGRLRKVVVFVVIFIVLLLVALVLDVRRRVFFALHPALGELLHHLQEFLPVVLKEIVRDC